MKAKGMRCFSITCTAFVQDTWQVNIWKEELEIEAGAVWIPSLQHGFVKWFIWAAAYRPYITFLVGFVGTLSHSWGLEEFIVLVWTDKNKKGFSAETLGKAEGEECWHETAGLHFPKSFSRPSSLHSSLAEEPGLRCDKHHFLAATAQKHCPGVGFQAAAAKNCGPGVGTLQRESLIAARGHNCQDECVV